MAPYLDKLNKKLEVIKYLHEPHTREQCAKKLKIDERTIRNYRNEGDVKIGNVIIPFEIKENSDGRSLSNSRNVGEDIKPNDLMSRSSVHPVVLPLNLTEVYMMTLGILKKLGNNHPEYEAYRRIAIKIYSQLSDYAKKCIDRSNHDLYSVGTVRYISEADMFDNNYKGAISESLKDRIRFRVILFDDSHIDGYFDHKNTDIFLVTDRGEWILFENLGVKDIKKI